jgi:hypothetical protein
VRWPAAPAHALDAACAGLADLIDGQAKPRRGVADRAQQEFRGNKSAEFAARLDANGVNARTLLSHLQAMRSALVAAEQWAADEQAARERARQVEDDRRWFGLKGLYNDLVG